ncbi:trimeric intracellular cation channel family protein [Rhodoferax sp. U11-2br]|uniref:trimeric intracellular cation channel family protein n=1 Tax=Rhodoferax sp. U11-2br TaxID=2838878 RepID=UPI001BE84974|nr:trimeric intracellular cation channel family protein [Rhodoferax sp. U11-2br]MBT3067796.1 trimeric intracellular cation channel family protein [Rhodoferax sp. U11-2br]
MQHIQQWGETLRLLVELAGTAAFALSGVLEGARKKLDAVGICVVGFLAAFGGGTLRDLLLDQRPFFWVRHVEMLWAVMLICLLSMLFLRSQHLALTQKTIAIPDALGLGLFAATGVDLALGAHMPALVAVLMGVITGVFGGVLRDIVCNEIPTTFRDQQPYAVCAFVGGWAYLGVWELGAPGWLALLTCLLVTAGLRGLSLWRQWRLPVWLG